MFAKCIKLNTPSFYQQNALEGAAIDNPDSLSLLAHTQLAHCQKMQDKIDAAIESYTKALELDPHSAEIAGLIGRLYYIEGNNTLALEYLGFAIEIATEDVLVARPEFIADLYLQRVKVYESLQMMEHARAD